MEVVLALDVGGTTVAGDVVAPQGQPLGEARGGPSPEGEPAEVIVGRLAGLLVELRGAARAGGLVPVAAGLALPGPFDYQAGISRMRHKFASLYGRDLKEPLEDAVGMPVYFLNDALAFTLGAWWAEHQDEARLLGITVGTGLGAGFVVGGRPAGEEEGSRELWDLPYGPSGEGILEDAVSARAVERLHRDLGGKAGLGVEGIAHRARGGEEAAAEAFRSLGRALGEGLALGAGGFRPGRVACGGQISKAFELFGRHAEDAFAATAGWRVPFFSSGRDDLPLMGVARFVRLELER